MKILKKTYRNLFGLIIHKSTCWTNQTLRQRCGIPLLITAIGVCQLLPPKLDPHSLVILQVLFHRNLFHRILLEFVLGRMHTHGSQRRKIRPQRVIFVVDLIQASISGPIRSIPYSSNQRHGHRRVLPKQQNFILNKKSNSIDREHIWF